jgi:beta-lactamase regulating signal transducer with metallopeptidase domain
MYLLESLAQWDWWYVAGWTMLHYLWLGALVGAAAGVSGFALRRAGANVRYAVALAWLAVLAVLPIGVGVWVGGVGSQESGVGVAIVDADAKTDTDRHAIPSNPAPTALTPPAPGSAGGIVRSVPDSAAPLSIDSATSMEPLPAGEPNTTTNPRQSRGLRAGSGWNPWIETAAGYLPWLWIIGAPLTFLLLASGIVGTERLRRESRVLSDGPIADCTARIAQSLAIGRRVTIAICERVATPVLVGIVRPMILFPPAALTGWSPEEIEMVLLHELAHVRRWDNLVNLAQRIVEAALYFQPAVWLVSNWVRREREACCDAVVVGKTQQPQAYAELLVALAAQLPRSVLFHPAATSAMAAGPIRGRIRRVLGIDDDPMLVSGKSLGVLMAGLLLAATLTVLNLPAHSQAEESSDAAGETDQPQDVADALNNYRQAVVGYDLDFDSVFPQRDWQAYDAKRLDRYPIRDAWPDVLGHVDTDAAKFRVTRTKPAEQYTTATGGNAYLVPLTWSLGTENYATLLFLRGIEADAHVIAHSYTSFACFGPMAGDVLFKSYATALVDGEMSGQITAESYYNLVVTGKFTGRIDTSSYAMIYLIGGFDGEMEIENSKVFIAGRTTKADLQKIRGPGKVYLEESDLAPGEHKIGKLLVTVKSSPADERLELQDVRRQQAQSLNNLKDLSLALLNYESATRRFPPQAKFDAAGKPLLSWRVLVLPYLGTNEATLYQEFHLDEPWDSDHNRKLITRMPKVFQNPRIDKPGMTNYLAVSGQECMFDGSENGVRIAQVSDGTSKTISIVEANADLAVEWTKPQDWEFDRANPTSGLGGLWSDRWLATWVDGSTRAVLSSTPPDEIGIQFTRAGGEVKSLNEPRRREEVGGGTYEETGRYGAAPESQSVGSPALVAVPFVVGASRFEDGDSIEIIDIRGSTDTFEPGNVYWIKGRYTLASRDRAQLSAFTTARNVGEGRSSIQKIQTTTIDRGSGEFTLWLPMTVSGWPHVSFYPDGGGNGFGGIYIGTGDSVLTKWWGEKDRAAEGTEITGRNDQDLDKDKLTKLKRYFAASAENVFVTERYSVPPEQHKAVDVTLLAFVQDPFGPKVEFEYVWLDKSSEVEITAPRAAHDEVFVKMFRNIAEDAATASERESNSDPTAAKVTDETSDKSPTAGLEESLEKKISFCVVLFNAPGRSRDLQDLYQRFSQEGRTIYLHGYTVDPESLSGKRYRLTAEPTCIVYKHGQETARLEGIESKEQLVEFVERASIDNRTMGDLLRDKDRIRSLFVPGPLNSVQTYGWDIKPGSLPLFDALVELLEAKPRNSRIQFHYEISDGGSRLQTIAPKAAQQSVIKAIVQMSRDAERPIARARQFPTLEEQKLADAIYRRLGLEMEPLSADELRRVQTLGYDGGMKVTQNDGSVISWETNRGGILPNDILVGLHVWPTKSAADIVAVLQRDDLAELSPLKFYLVRPTSDPNTTKNPPDTVVTGRIPVRVIAVKETEKEAQSISANSPRVAEGTAMPIPLGSMKTSATDAPTTEQLDQALADDPGMQLMNMELMLLQQQLKEQQSHAQTGQSEESDRLKDVIMDQLEKIAAHRASIRENLTDKMNSELRYNGKTFAQWRTAWQTELSTEQRLESVRALAAFGANGYGKEVAQSIVEVAPQYSLGEWMWALGPGRDTADNVMSERWLIIEMANTLGIGGKSASFQVQFDDTLAALKFAAKSQDANRRTFAALVLAFRSINDPKTEKALLPLLIDEDKSVRDTGLQVYMNLKSRTNPRQSTQPAIEFLKQSIADAKSHTVTEIAKRALTKLESNLAKDGNDRTE